MMTLPTHKTKIVCTIAVSSRMATCQPLQFLLGRMLVICARAPGTVEDVCKAVGQRACNPRKVRRSDRRIFQQHLETNHRMVIISLRLKSKEGQDGQRRDFYFEA